MKVSTPSVQIGITPILPTPPVHTGSTPNSPLPRLCTPLLLRDTIGLNPDIFHLKIWNWRKFNFCKQWKKKIKLKLHFFGSASSPVSLIYSAGSPGFNISSDPLIYIAGSPGFTSFLVLLYTELVLQVLPVSWSCYILSWFSWFY